MTESMSDENFVLRNVHPAPADVAFAVMTEPRHLSHFWGPIGTRTPEERIVVDLRPGGAFETTMVNESTGETYTMRAVYLEVEPGRRLSWRDLEHGVVTELSFRDLGDGTTEVMTVQRGLPPALRTPEARAGWATALARHGEYLARLASSTRPNDPEETLP